ncbi:SDR family NAD(P)-dependent oxidoreductase [Estrella lausannensis]|uniref:3-oxoacyl-ACP reductase n=1 Tax=Estrella lausannensis TaxID=483423 RepID=A0A0H5DPW8_9BACT|nr:SDR family NAD(P)-dependent oxidoreductase [Estrella lausannensis]CRX38532.1 3-oxoacyl-ACP reductase [Estrella lausannensis]
MSRREPFRLALITGATSGIGRELAYLMASKQIPLLLTGRNSEELKRIQGELSKSVAVSVCTLDLLNEEDRRQLVLKIREFKPDLIVNNAGFGLYGPLYAFGAKEQLSMIDILVKAVVELTVEGVNTLKQNSLEGVILNVSSTASFFSMPWMNTYAASKAFCTSFSLAADAEVREAGIRVLCSCPGVVKTGFRKTASGGEVTGDTSSFLDMEVGYAAARMWKQILSRKPLDVFDWKYRALLFLSRLLPRSLVHRLIMAKLKTITPQTIGR